MLDPESRRIVEAFRDAKDIRIVLNDKTDDRIGLHFVPGSEAYRNLRGNLRVAIQAYMNDVRNEAERNSEKLMAKQE